MKLTSCPRCERHVLVEATSCPFCGTRLGTTSAFGRAMMVAVVGLSMSCGGDDSTETSVASATQGDPTVGATGETSINNETDAGGADYAGPGDTSLSAGPDDTTTDQVTSSGGTGDTETDTDTGSTTGAPATDSGGADYAGPGATTSG